MTSYLPGEHPCLVTDRGIVMAAPDRLADVVALGERDLDAPTVVEVLSRGVLGDLPDFAAVRRDGVELRIMVRGAFSVRVDGFALDGRDAATWNEASAAIGAGSVVEIGPVGPVGPVGTSSGGVGLPIAGGVVHTRGVTWPLDEPAPAAPAPAAPAPVPAPSPTPAAAPMSAAAPVPRADDYTSVRPSPGAAPTPTLVVPAVPAGLPPSPPSPPSPPLPATPATPANPPTPPSPAPVWSPAAVGDPADHDGRTITPAQLQALRAAQGAPLAPPAPPPARPLVALALSTGRVVPVRRRVLIGRSPRVQQVGGSANLPALVTVDDPYVSSTHLEVAVDGTRVTVTDTSTNGTLLARRGGTPFPLDHGVATEVAVGDVLTLSKGLTATFVPAPER